MLTKETRRIDLVIWEINCNFAAVNIKNKIDEVMKQIITAITLALTMTANVQAQDNTWEQVTASEKAVQDAKYLVGAVPEKNGRVVFETTIKVPGKNRTELFGIMQRVMTAMTKEAGQLEKSTITTTEPDKGLLVGSYQEWLVFKNKPLILDRTRLYYNLVADCNDGEVHLSMNRIFYIYDEERTPLTYKAEEWITDRYGLNKKQTKLARVSGKFRKKTIDRKDYLFRMIEKELKK